MNIYIYIIIEIYSLSGMIYTLLSLALHRSQIAMPVHLLIMDISFNIYIMPDNKYISIIDILCTVLMFTVLFYVILYYFLYNLFDCVVPV